MTWKHRTMSNTLVSIFLFIFLVKTHIQNEICAFSRQPINLRTVANPEVSGNHLSTNDKKKIVNFLKSITNQKKATSSPNIMDPLSYCRSFRTCLQCAESRWYPCGWCHNYGCTDKPEKLCNYAINKLDLVDSNSTKDMQMLCPYIEHSEPIIAPAGIRQNLQVKVHVTDPVLYEKEIICQLKFRNRMTHLKALILDNFVYCYPVTLSTADRGDPNVGVLRLIWGGVRPFSNKIKIVVYDCQHLASDCISCSKIPPEYGCGWCGQDNTCVISDKCSDLLMWNINRLSCKSLR